MASSTAVEVVFRLVPLVTGGTPVEFTPRNTVAMGRDKQQCQMAYPDCAIMSRVHCSIFSLGRDVIVHDKSNNGTYVNGKVMGKDTRKVLRSGDVLSTLGPRHPDVAQFSWRFVAPEERDDSGKDDGSTGILAAYRLDKVLGTGNFATVKLGVAKATGRRVAVKIIDKKRFGLADTEFSFSSLQHEVEILRRMQHENIIGVVDVFDDAKHFTMVLELVEGGDLFDYIVGRCPHPFTEDEAKRLFLQLLEAMLYMHSKDVVHRDLKPENILVHVDPTAHPPSFAEDHQRDAKAIPVDKVTLKITDFGLAKFCSEHEVMTTMCGTPSYLAPEVLLPQAPGAKKAQGYSWSVDVWSLGVILYILLSGTPPKNPQGGLAFGPPFTRVSATAQDLVRGMLRPDPRQRFDLADIVGHPWVASCTIRGRELAQQHERPPQMEGTMVAPAAQLLSMPTAAGAMSFASFVVAAAAAVEGPRTAAHTGAAVPPVAGAVPLTAAALGADAGAKETSAGGGTDVDSDGSEAGGMAPPRGPKRPRLEGEDAASGSVSERLSLPAIVWSWKKSMSVPDTDESAWAAYGKEDCAHIERHYQKKSRSCKVGSTGEYRIAFDGMFQYRASDTSKQRPVRRVVVPTPPSPTAAK